MSLTLTHACALGDLAAVCRHTVNNCADINQLNAGLYFACREGQEEIVKYLLSIGANDIEEGFNNACYGGHLNLVKYLMGMGKCCLNIGFGFACYSGKFNIVDFLLESGLDINTGIFGACRTKNLNAVKYVISLDTQKIINYNAVLLVACASDDLDIVKYIIQMGADNIDQAISVAMCSKNTVILDYLSDHANLI